MSWNKAISRKRKAKQPQTDSGQVTGKHIAEVQLHAKEVQEMLQEFGTCDFSNIIHAAKITRIGEKHIRKARGLFGKIKDERNKAKREINSSKTEGIKALSRAIGDAPAKPLTCVFRDRDTEDGGEKGEMTSNPKDVDAVVKRAWKAVYSGMSGCMETGIQWFLVAYTK